MAGFWLTFSAIYKLKDWTAEIRHGFVRLWVEKNRAQRETPRKRSNLTHRSRGDKNVNTKNPQLNTTMGITGMKVRKKKERTVTRSGQNVNTTVVSNGGRVDLQVLPTACAMLAKGLAKLETTPIGNVQLGKKVAITHHQGDTIRVLGMPRKEIAR